MAEKQLVIGPEHDDELRTAVVAVLKQIGGRQRSHERGVAGSQEVETLEVDVDGQLIVVEAETYVGLSIRGPEELVDRVSSLIANHRRDLVSPLPRASAKFTSSKPK